MKLLEDVYNEVIVNEKLKRINLNPTAIRQKLERQYKEAGRQQGNISYKPRANEEFIVADILKVLSAIDNNYENAFISFKTNPNKFKNIIINLDNNWHTYYNNVLQQYLRQASKLVFLDLLKEMGINIPIRPNEAGNPVYPFHLINRYMQMNILEQMIKSKKIDPATKEAIEGIIFDQPTKSQIQRDIDEYTKRTNVTIKSEPEEIEERIPEAPSKAERLEMIKKIAQRMQ